MKDIIYDYMLALAGIWWSGLCSFFGCFPCQIHGACGGPLQSQGKPTTPARHGRGYRSFFSPASLCQRVPPIRGAPMAPILLQGLRGWGACGLCVLLWGWAKEPTPVTARVVGVGQRAHPRYSPEVACPLNHGCHWGVDSLEKTWEPRVEIPSCNATKPLLPRDLE